MLTVPENKVPDILIITDLKGPLPLNANSNESEQQEKVRYTFLGHPAGISKTFDIRYISLPIFIILIYIW